MPDPDRRPTPAAPPTRRDADARDPDATRRLLTLPLRHRDVLATDEAVVRFADDLADAVGATATLRSPREEPAGERVLALPLTIRGRLEAHLDLTREAPFDAAERELLDETMRLIDDRLVQLSQWLEIEAFAAITTSFAAAETAEQGIRRGLESVLRHTGALAGAFLVRREDGVEERVRVGDWPEGEGEEARRRTFATACLRREEPVVRGDGLVAYRLGSGRPVRHVALFRFAEDAPLGGIRLANASKAGEAIAPHLDALLRREAHVELLRFQGQPWDRPAHELYEALLETAIRLVPGADSGSLLLRHDPTGPFAFEAARGFDEENLLEERLSIDEVRAWYGGDDPGWARGRSRVLRAEEVDLTALSWDASPGLERRGSGVDRIRATLCLPILRDGRVMAVLNLDAQRDPDAFGLDSLAVADLFGPPIADLLQRQRAQEALKRAALTDPLTGLDNRRPLLAALKRELARHARSGTPVSVLVMDLSGFKRINDESGHVVGDEALVRVAAALRAHVRDTDLVARWGGDEFAALLVDAPAAQAAEAAERLRDAVGRLLVHGHRLAANVGAATAPEDGLDEEELIRTADARMYEEKRAAGTAR